MAINLDAGQELNPARGRDFCRGCSGVKLFSALDLGDLPIANELQKSPVEHVEKFPLHLRICEECGLGQVADVVTPERIFRDYRYLSSMSSTFSKHVAEFVEKLVANNMVNSTDWVLEIASNDGYLLKNFLPHGISVLGIEPARNVGELARRLGVETISEFFSNSLAAELLNRRGYPKVIFANNVMAHVPDLLDFIKGLALLCGPKTTIIVENPTLLSILEKKQFDTIYHEHFSYLSATAVNLLCNSVGLKLIDVESLAVHGDSNRYWIKRGDCQRDRTISLEVALKTERDRKLFKRETWADYSVKVKTILKTFQYWLEDSYREERRVFGYGAAAKASTLLNSINFKPDQLIAIADISSEKQSRYMPSFGIRIISPEELKKSNPTDIVIFPWNIADEISAELKQILQSGVRFWCAIPSLHEL